MLLDTPKQQQVTSRPKERAIRWARQMLYYWEQPIPAACLAASVYLVITALFGPVWRTSNYHYFNYLADALLHQQLNLRVLPEKRHDLSFYHGQYYLYWPPLPAVLLIPFVFIFGIGFSDILFTIGLGAINIALVAILLRVAVARRIVRLTRAQRAFLVLFVALGTVHLTLAPYGRVWFTAQIVGFGCLLLGYLAALTQSGVRGFVLTGIAIAAAFLTRNHLLFAGFWPACYLLYQSRTASWQRLAGYTLAGLAPVFAAIGVLGVYNALRFGSAFDNGLAYHNMAPIFRADYQRYGAFNLHYVPTNLFYQYLAYPLPLRETSDFGGSLFLLSPVFFAAVWGAVSGRPRWLVWALITTIVLVATPILLLMGTGYLQWGPRYSLDFTVPLLLLTAIGVRRWPIWVLAVLTALSIIQYVIGALFLGPKMLL